MKLQDYDAFIFDLDGTLIDSERYHAQAFADAVLDQSGYRLSPEEQREFFSKHSTWFAAELNERHGLSLIPEAVLAQKRQRVQEIFEAKPFDGARDFLERWFGKKPMALATNSPRRFVTPALEQGGLMKYFDYVTTADEVTNRKPDPEIVDRTVRKLQVDPLKTLVFEDQWIGIQAARAAGAHVLAVDNGQSLDFPVEVLVHAWSELLYMDGDVE
jgi:HAD superfamily hydrolase (TIGR01509 family)